VGAIFRKKATPPNIFLPYAGLLLLGVEYRTFTLSAENLRKVSGLQLAFTLSKNLVITFVCWKQKRAYVCKTGVSYKAKSLSWISLYLRELLNETCLSETMTLS